MVESKILIQKPKVSLKMYQTQSTLGYSPRDTRHLLAKEVLSPLKKYCLKNNIRTLQDLALELQKENNGSSFLQILESDFSPAGVSVRAEMLLWLNTRESPPAQGKGTRKPSCPCVCTDTGEEFPSFLAAARRFGITATAVAGCCRGKLESAGGYHFSANPEDIMETKKRQE